MPVLSSSGHLLFAKAFSSMALQLYGQLIYEDYVIKCLDHFKAFLAPVQSLLIFLHCLTASGSGEGPAKLIAKSCNGSHTVLDICCCNFCQDIFEGRSSTFIISSHCFINATIVAFWNSFWRSTSGEVSHITNLLPSCDYALDCLACSDYPLHGESSCNSCHCHFLTSLGPHRNNSCSLIVA